MPAVSSTSSSASVKKESVASRGALACQPCRKAKRTCDGSPPPGLPTAQEWQQMDQPELKISAGIPCLRCARLQKDCVWIPSARTGRPRKLQLPNVREQSNDRIGSGQSESSISPVERKVLLPAVPSPSPSGASASTSNQVQSSLPPLPAISTLNNHPPPFVSPRETEPIPSSSRHYEESLSYHSPSQFSAQANLLSQQGSLDGTMDAGALDEALYSMWPEDFSYNWAHSGHHHQPSELHPEDLQVETSASPLSNVGSLPSTGESAGTFNLASSVYSEPSTSSPNVTYAGINVRTSGSPSAREQFDQLCTFLGPASSSFPSQETLQDSPIPLHRDVVNLGHETHLSRSLQEGCEHFFDLASQMVPVLGASVDFYSSPSSQDPLLLHSVAAMGYHLSGSTSTAAPSILAQARHLAEDCIARNGMTTSYLENEHGPSSHAVGVLTQVQSFIILSLLEFGLAQLDRAGRLLKAAVDLCLREGVHKVDELTALPAGAGGLPLQGLCVTQMEDAGTNRKWLAESLRRTWWELFSQDVIMYCSTSGRIGGQIGSRGGIYVSFCSDFGEELEANPRRDLCSMRVRAVTILAESIKQVPNDQSAGQARLHTLDVMTSNLAVTAHHAFVREVTAGKRFSSRAVEVSRVNRMRTESPFVTLLILSCARVHMHRLYALPNLSFQLESGSFAPIGNARPSTLDRARIASSIEKIVNASESLLTLVRTDYEVHTEMAEMIGSSVIGDEMSSLRGLNTSSPSHSASPSFFGHVSPLLAHQPAFAACQLTSCWGLVCAVAWSSQSAAGSMVTDLDRERALEEKEAAIWRQRKAISNISFVESNIETHARVWPIAGRLLQEVKRCKESVDGVAKSW